MPWVKFEDESVGDVVLELSETTLGVHYARNSETPRMHLAMLSVSVDGPDRKGRRTVSVQAKPGAMGASFRLKVAEQDWPRVSALLDLVGPAQRALEPPVG